MKEITKEKSVHINHRNRMKNIFVEHGFSAFTEVQKLEFILFFAIPQKDTNPIAHKLLDEFGSIKNVISANFSDLVKVDGIGTHAALLLKSYKALLSDQNLASNLKKIGSSTEAKQYMFEILRNSNVEEFYVVCLDEDNKIIKTKKINSGSANKVGVEIRDITSIAFSCNSSKIIIAHNHPSNNCNFSDEDLAFTHSIMCSCLLNDILLVDHVLVTPTNVRSLAESKVFEAIQDRAIKKVNLSSKDIAALFSPKTPYVVIKIDE